MKRIIALACVAILSTSLCFAETVYLKNGKKITGKIVQQDDQQLKIDVSGVKITYFTDEIDRVEGAAAATETKPAPETKPVPAPATPSKPSAPVVAPVTPAPVPAV